MEKKTFLNSLFDLSFDSFVTTKIIKLIFLLLVVIAVINGVIMLFGALAAIFSGEIIMGLLTLLSAPLLTIIFIVVARVYCELIAVTFRIAENLKDILTLQKEQAKQGSVNMSSSASSPVGSAPAGILRK